MYLSRLLNMKTLNISTLITIHLLFLSLLFTISTHAGETVTVYKSPTCGCCAKWVDYMRDNGFEVVAHDIARLNDMKAKLGMTNQRLMSCHTAVIGDYLVEGHVPASDIKRMLKDKPQIKGLTAPGMPQLSPGMASLEPKGYDVLSFDNDGNINVFSSY
ncbi:MAG: hypothetical protein ACI8P9_005033 [Parasphingorhabdus sp.]|jgi:hypothetical protein